MDKKRASKYMVRRSNLIDGLLSVLEQKVSQAERHLLEKSISGFMDRLELTEDGRVRSTLFNKRLLATIDNVFDKFGKTVGVEISKTILEGVQSVTSFNGSYFKTFTTDAKLLPIQNNVQETLKAWLGLGDKGKIEPNGYLDTLIKDTTVKNQIKDFAVRAVIGQQGWMESKKQLSEILVGNKEKAGAMQRYYRNFVYDTYSQVDRATSEIYSEKLGLQFAIYEGGLIKSSRKFCKERNGKVFHITEIAKFNPPTAKPPGYNPFTDLGGYGCRHHLNYIPDSLAIMLRPDAKDLIGNKITTPQPAAKPAKTEAPKQAPKPVEKPKAAPKAKTAPAPVSAAAPTATNIDKIVNAKTAREYLGEVVKDFKVGGRPPKIVFSASLNPGKLKEYSRQVGKLFDEYSLNTNHIEEIRFKSTNSAYGRVSAYLTGKINYINFGDRADGNRIKEYKDGASKISSQNKSRVDNENLQVSTATHEFAHAIGISVAAATPEVKNFFKDLAVIKKEYHNEVNTLIRADKVDAAAKIFLGKYASTNIDEFWAESFTEFKLKTNPSKYAKKVGELANKYFKKKPDK